MSPQFQKYDTPFQVRPVSPTHFPAAPPTIKKITSHIIYTSHKNYGSSDNFLSLFNFIFCNIFLHRTLLPLTRSIINSNFGHERLTKFANSNVHAHNFVYKHLHSRSTTCAQIRGKIITRSNFFLFLMVK